MSFLDQLVFSFSEDHDEAQRKFLQACAAQGLSHEAHVHPLKGPHGEPLVTHVARVGPEDAGTLLVIVSGTHGLEALAGAGCQVAWLRHGGIEAMPDDTAVLLVHIINPWGCAWQRRQNEDNVDLNRSFLAPDAPRPFNEIYHEFHGLLTHAASSARASEDPDIRAYLESRGEDAVFGALMTGQHEFPDGLGYCGSKPSWSRKILEDIVDRHAQRASKVGVIDLHSGLGPFGYGSIYSLADVGSEELARARALFGPSVFAIKEGDAAYPTQGELVNWISSRVPGQCTGVAVEYGTYDMRTLIMLEIDDTRIWREGSHRTPQADAVRRALSDFFYPTSTDWRQYVAMRALQVIGTMMRIRSVTS